MMDRKALLAQADLAPLLMCYVHLSGDSQALDDYAPYITGPWAFHEQVPPALRQALVQKCDALLSAIDAGHRHAAQPDAALLHRMMSVCVGQKVPDEYLPLILHEMQLAGSPPLEVNWRKPPDAARLARFKVLVIGAGESGLCAGIKLKQLGIPFEILEKDETVGGTWFENSYPGCGVDTPNHFYQYSFEPNHDWSRYFSPRDEIWKYLERCADRYGLRPQIRFRTEVTAMCWNESTQRWHVTMRNADGRSETLHAQAVICAVGQLNRPHIPELPGLSDFKGAMFHTAAWDHGVDLKDKRVGMIGTGASGMQVGPAVIDQVQHLSIFQRSPHWAMHNPLYFAEVKDGKKWALKNLPNYAHWYRFQLFWASADGLYPSLRVDPDWPTPDLSLNAVNHAMRNNLVAYIEKEVGHDADLVKKAVPQYPPYGKRMLRDNHWYRMLTNPKAELITEGIERVTADGVSTSDGHTHQLDVLVMATGFQAHRLTWPMDIKGRGGVTLRHRWGEDDPRAYLGITVPDFPNFFLLFGPNTTLAHGGSAIFQSECQTRYTLMALRELIENDLGSLDCKPAVHDAFNLRVDAIHSKMVWSHRGVGSWYKNKAGRVFATSPWRLVDYWQLTRVFASTDYRITPSPAKRDTP